MRWSDVINDRNLANLPYKIELNHYGQITMSPASNHHGLLQVEIAFFLRANKQGKVLVECSIDTSQGVKVTDVAWGSNNFFLQHKIETPYNTAPELCVEIISPSNSKKEMTQKTHLYLQAGAKEVWICEQSGNFAIYNHLGQTHRSIFFDNLPNHFNA